jgi:1-deoxy-D-xylulose-5-phosphate synthase
MSAPRDGARLRETFREAIDIHDVPSVVRFPKGAVVKDIDALDRIDGIDVLYQDKNWDVLLVSVGALANLALDVAVQVGREGIGVTVIDPRWVKPLPESLVAMATAYQSVVVIENGIRHGGIASTISEIFRDAGLSIPIHSIGVPLEFIEHSKPAEILQDLGMNVQDLSRSIVEWHSCLKEEMQHHEDESVSRRPLH